MALTFFNLDFFHVSPFSEAVSGTWPGLWTVYVASTGSLPWANAVMDLVLQ